MNQKTPEELFALVEAAVDRALYQTVTYVAIKQTRRPHGGFVVNMTYRDEKRHRFEAKCVWLPELHGALKVNLALCKPTFLGAAFPQESTLDNKQQSLDKIDALLTLVAQDPTYAMGPDPLTPAQTTLHNALGALHNLNAWLRNLRRKTP